MDILALMLSIPESFFPKKDLYNCPMDTKNPDKEFMFRGIVMYTGAHYVTYIRTIKSKMDYILDMSNPRADLDQIDRESTPELEWTLFDDGNI